jgi:hypothetical protein
MLRLLVVCSALMGVDASKPADASAEDVKAYQDACTKVGRDAEAHVRLALWCEAHGMPAERLKHLTTAMLVDPAHAIARALSGFVKDGETWRKPDALAEKLSVEGATASHIAEYGDRRARTPDTADGHWALSQWCEQQGLHDESRAHLWNVVRLDPRRPGAWKQLGYKRVGDRWESDEQIALEKAESDAQAKADRIWKPRLETWKGWLANKGKKAEVEQRLASVTDPRAVRAVIEVFGHGKVESQSVAVQLLGQIPTVASSRALVILAIYAKSSKVRRSAAETLAQRDPRESMDLLIAALRKPLKYEVKPINGPDSPGVLFVEGQQFNIRRFYTIARAADPRAFDAIANSPDRTAARAALIRMMTGGEVLLLDPSSALVNTAGGLANPRLRSPATPVNGLNAGSIPSSSLLNQDIALLRGQAVVERNVAEYQKMVLSSQQQLANDVAAVEAENVAIRRLDDRVLPTLEALSGQQIGPDPGAWSSWWADQQGYVYNAPAKPTFQQTVPPSYMPSFVSLQHSCFAAGTLVNTISGSRPIESVQVGDRLLSQNPRTGVLDYEAVVRIYHNRPDKTLRIRLGDETIVATPIHRFWRAGGGWAMARELKTGDLIRTVGSVAKVESIEAGAVQPVFNLELPERHSFFVGACGALVHDNSLVRPIPEPFDAPKPTPELRHASE